MLAIRLPKEIEEELKVLSQKTGKTINSHANEAIVNYLDDLEDDYLGYERMKTVRKTISLENLIMEEFHVAH